MIEPGLPFSGDQTKVKKLLGLLIKVIGFVGTWRFSKSIPTKL